MRPFGSARFCDSARAIPQRAPPRPHKTPVPSSLSFKVPYRDHFYSSCLPPTRAALLDAPHAPHPQPPVFFRRILYETPTPYFCLLCCNNGEINEAVTLPNLESASDLIHLYNLAGESEEAAEITSIFWEGRGKKNSPFDRNWKEVSC